MSNLYPDLKPRVRTLARKRAGAFSWGNAWYPVKPTEVSLGKSIGPPLLKLAMRKVTTDYPRKHVPESKSLKSLVDRGGPFVSRQVVLRHDGSGYHYKTTTSPRYMTSEPTYVEKKIFADYNPMTSLTLPTFEPEFAFWGPKAFQRLRPDKKGPLGQFIIEARELPTLPFRTSKRVNEFRELGKDYLNVEFGWKPFLRDIQESLILMKDLDVKWRKMLKQRHRLLRRKAIIFTDSGVTESSTAYGKFITRGGATSCYPDYSTKRETRTISDTWWVKYWASGAFRVSVPDVSFPLLPEREFRQLYNTLGAFPTPSLVWKVIPWTWLIDWVSNLGAIIDNYESYALDGVTADYCYLMCHWHRERTTTVTGPWGSGKMTYYYDVKAREQASPYGFGVSMDSLTLSQQAILVALGMAKH